MYNTCDRGWMAGWVSLSEWMSHNTLAIVIGLSWFHLMQVAGLSCGSCHDYGEGSERLCSLSSVTWRFDNQRAMHSMTTVPYLRGERPGRGVYHSRPSSREVMNMLNYTVTSTNTFMEARSYSLLILCLLDRASSW